MTKSGLADFTIIYFEGSLFFPDFVHTIFARTCEGTSASDYHHDDEHLNEVLSHSWAQLCQLWQRSHSANQPFEKIAHDKWLLPLFEDLGFGRLQKTAPIVSGNQTYPISHLWNTIPIHIVHADVELDAYTKVRGSSMRQSPYSLVQGLLNSSDTVRWGIVANGKKLRLLRSNRHLSHQTYIEFNLEDMLVGEHYADFVLFWLLCHESRFEEDQAKDCWLEQWLLTSRQQSTRALGKLREGVEKAIVALGGGFIQCPANQTLRDDLRKGEISQQQYYQQLLRLVYRLIILFVAEDRDVLFAEVVAPVIKQRYMSYYSLTHLRQVARKHTGTRHKDLFWCLRIVMDGLSGPSGCAELGLSVLNGFLFSPQALPNLEHCELANRDLLAAIRALTFVTSGAALREIDYKHIGPEELGSIYETLLERHAIINISAKTFELRTTAGNARKTTGSYYTPDNLVQCLLDSALEPVLDRACAQAQPQETLLALKVCDPACGSGHFLIAAAQRIANRLARLRKLNEIPTKEEQCKALRDVITHCIYGVDINPMAVELCKVTLWMAALTPGIPLAYLENHILCGDSLLGSTPAMIQRGIPDAAFNALPGDDSKLCREYARRNKEGRAGQLHLLIDPMDVILRHQRQIDGINNATFDGIHQLDNSYQEMKETDEYQYYTFIMDAWCAAFVWPMHESAPQSKAFPMTEGILREAVLRGQTYQDMVNESERLKAVEEYNFFHWFPAFSDVFRLPQIGESPDNADTGLVGGFDVVLSNPPWDRVVLQEKEWFARFDADIEQAANSSQRKEKIAILAQTNPKIFQQFQNDTRIVAGKNHFLRQCERYPLCGRGQVNLYAIFAEMMRQIINPTGHVGCIVQSGIATDDTTKQFFHKIIETQTLISLYDFDNTKKIFPDIDSRQKFCLLTMNGTAIQTQTPDFTNFLHEPKELQIAEKHYSLSAEDIALLNPNTHTSPIFRSKRDVELAKKIYAKFPIFAKEGVLEKAPWTFKFLRMFDMAGDSYLFRSRKQLELDSWKLEDNIFCKGQDRYLPLYEGKMIYFYDHRFATYDWQTTEHIKQGKTAEVTVEQHQKNNTLVMPYYWIPGASFDKIDIKHASGCLTFRDTTNATNQRTVIASIIPALPCGHTLPVIILGKASANTSLLKLNMLSCLSSFVFDYITRQKIGGNHLTFSIFKQLPVLHPKQYQVTCPWDTNQHIGQWILPRTLELTYTAWDLQAFAHDCGYDGSPFVWDEERRFLLQCELDAAYFHLYGVTREDVDYVMDTFTLLSKEELKKYHRYRTKHMILEIYDEMQQSISTGATYQTHLPPLSVEGTNKRGISA